MDRQTGNSDGNDNGDCSEDDLNKGSDDVVNVVKSPKQTSNTHLILPNKIKYICIGTMVSVIGIVVMVVLSATILLVSTDDKQNGFQLLTAVLKISNQLDSLLIKTKSESSTTDGTLACKNINTSYLYYALREDIRKLREELLKTKSRKDDKKNNLQLTKDISRISNQLESLSTKMNSYSSTTDGSQTCEKNNASYLFYIPQKENRKLKDELKTRKSRKDLITCADTHIKQNQEEERKKSLQVSCSSVPCAHNIYKWVSANRSVSFGHSDHLNILIQFKLLYPEIPDNAKTLFEFGLTTLAGDFKFNYPAIIVRGQRCGKESGMCLYVEDSVLTKLEGHVFDQFSDYMQGQLIIELHKSNFVLMSNQKNIYISNTVNLSSKVELWPVFGFYNTHLINISQTILSENKLSFNRTTVDPHLFVSKDNNTISNCKLWPIEKSLTRWDINIMVIEIAFVVVSTTFFLIFITEKGMDFQIVLCISGFLCLPLSLYYLYMNWSVHLLVVVSTLLGILLYNLKYNSMEQHPMRYPIFTFLDSTYIVILFKMLRYIFYLIFF